MAPAVAIVGRPNVGKSTLFNRLAGRRIALVDDRPGVTRDRREIDVRFGELAFRLIDTAGLDTGEGPQTLSARMTAQARRAIAAADLCLFMIDARAGLTPEDERIAAELRRAGARVIVLANKHEGEAAEAGWLEAFSLGFGEPVAISAEHGLGLADLFTAMLEALGPEAFSGGEDEETDDGQGERDPAKPLRIAIVGRPNAGKSTLINRLIGEDRLLTGPEAGITRDAIEVPFLWDGRPVKLFDTAGMRRRARVVEKLEKLSVADGLRAIRFAEIVVVLMDAREAFEAQDLHIAALIEREGRGVVLAVNKWDLVEDRATMRRALEEAALRLLPQIAGAPLVTLSAETGEGLNRLYPAIAAAERAWNTRTGTGELNRWLADAVERHTPPAVRGRRIKLRYLTQARTRPPTFVLFGTQLDKLPAAYLRYLVNGLRADFSMPGTPIRLNLRSPKNPYTER